MNKRLQTLCITLMAMLAISIAIPVPAQGNGTTTAPPVTQIASAKDLAAFREAVNSGTDYKGETVTLTQDITVTDWTASIGSTSFTGTFDGNGHVITLTGSANLFNKIEASGTVKNLGMKVTIDTEDLAGGIAGKNYGTIQRCYVEGSITSTGDYTSGIAENLGLIEDCYTTVSVTATTGYYSGGIAERNLGGSIRRCYATGAISSPRSAGIAGTGNTNSLIQNCIALNESITETGTTRARIASGGVILSGNYASPLIPGTWNNKGADKNDGEDLTEATFIGKGAGEGAFAGWDADAWDFGDNTRLPKLKGFTGTQPADGITRESVMPKPLITSIASAEDLAAFREAVNSGTDYKGETVTLTQDITVTGWTAGIGSTSFKGTFDGNGHVITLTGSASLFNKIGAKGTVKNLGMKVTIDTEDQAGGIAVENSGTIQRCYVEGSITSTKDYTCGIADNLGLIEDCYTTVSVTTTGYYSGGIAGGNQGGTIRRCYATGAISSPGSAGIAGAGFSTNSIQNCIALNESITVTGFIRARIAYGSGTFSDNYASPLIPGEWTDKGADKNDGEDLTEATFIGQGAGEGAFTGWPTDETSAWDFGDNTRLPKLKTTGSTTDGLISGQGDKDGNMPARADFLGKIIEISTAVTYEEATHKDKDILVKDGGIFTIATDNASLKQLTIEAGGQVVAGKAFTCATLLAPRTLGNRWTAYGSPVYMNAVATTSQTFYRLSGYKSQSNQSWSSDGHTTNTFYSIAALNLIATEANNVPVTLTAPNTGSDPVTIPADQAAPTGEDLYTGIFLFLANPTLKNVEIPMAYILSDDGTRFERTENAVVKPFQSYVVANAATMRSVTSLRAGGIPTANEAVALPDGTFRVWGGDGQLHLSADKPSDVAIYDADGRLVQRLALTGERTLSLGRGIYFVHSNNITYKVSL